MKPSRRRAGSRRRGADAQEQGQGGTRVPTLALVRRAVRAQDRISACG